jgi:cytochrome c2
MRRLPALIGVAMLLTMAACSRLSSEQVNNASIMTGGGDARAGRETILKYGCNACHTISGVPGW